MTKIIIEKKHEAINKSVGIYQEADGEFLAMSLTESRNYKTYAGAARWVVTWGPWTKEELKAADPKNAAPAITTDHVLLAMVEGGTVKDTSVVACYMNENPEVDLNTADGLTRVYEALEVAEAEGYVERVGDPAPRVSLIQGQQ